MREVLELKQIQTLYDHLLHQRILLFVILTDYILLRKKRIYRLKVDRIWEFETIQNIFYQFCITY
jgi:hypothetical protein